MRNFAQRWVEDRTFVWLITEEVLDEYREVLARLGVRRPLIGKIVNTLRTKGEHVKLAPTHNLSPDPDDNHICDCAEYGDADFIVTLNPKDFPQASRCPVGAQQLGAGIHETCDEIPDVLSALGIQTGLSVECHVCWVQQASI